MAQLSGTGIATIVCGSITLCFGCSAFIYLLFVLFVLGAFLLLAAAYFGWVVIPYILLLVAASLAISAGAKTSNKGLWIASLVLSIIASLGFVAVIVVFYVWNSNSNNNLALSWQLVVLFIIPLVMTVTLIILSGVGIAQADSERAKQEERRNRMGGQPMNVVVGAPPHPQAPPQYGADKY